MNTKELNKICKEVGLIKEILIDNPTLDVLQTTRLLAKINYINMLLRKEIRL